MYFRHVKKAKTDSTGFKMFEWLSNFSKNERYDFELKFLIVGHFAYLREATARITYIIHFIGFAFYISLQDLKKCLQG